MCVRGHVPAHRPTRPDVRRHGRPSPPRAPPGTAASRDSPCAPPVRRVGRPRASTWSTRNASAKEYRATKRSCKAPRKRRSHRAWPPTRGTPGSGEPGAAGAPRRTPSESRLTPAATPREGGLGLRALCPAPGLGASPRHQREHVPVLAAPPLHPLAADVRGITVAVWVNTQPWLEEASATLRESPGDRAIVQDVEAVLPGSPLVATSATAVRLPC